MAVKLTSVPIKTANVKTGKTAKAGPIVVKYKKMKDDGNDLEFDGAMKFTIRNADGVQKGKLSETLGEPKKQHKRLKPIDKKIRKSVRKQRKMLDRYLALHDRSSRKKKNGWARDLGSNVLKVVRD